MLFFSTNSWVIANSFGWRYFVPLIWVGMILLSLEARNLLAFLGRWQRNVLSVLLFAWLVFYLAQPFFSLRDYKIFKNIKTNLPGELVGYAGDYWLVWPAVMKNLTEGKPGFGFSFRGDGNVRDVRRYFGDEGRGGRGLAIECLNEDVDQCFLRVKSYLGNVVLDDAKPIGDRVWLMNLHYDPARAGLMNAPLLDGDFALGLTAKGIPSQWVRGTEKQCVIHLRNNGDVALSGVGGEARDIGIYAVRLSYRWVGAGSLVRPLDGFDNRTPLPALLGSKTEMTLNMAITAPQKPGRYWLEIEAVQDMVAWFKDKGCPGIRIAVEVN